MFESGKIYKVKIETNPGETGFGRATILEKSGSQLCIQVKTSKEANQILPKGTRIWFVSDAADNVFNGLWSSSITGAQLMGGKTSLLCSAPKLEPLLQRRRTPRVALDVPVKLQAENGQSLGNDVRSKDISRSGIALETAELLHDDIGHSVNIVVESTLGEIAAECRVIRVEKNWLANKSVIGLEYTDVTPEHIAVLDKLLLLLGGKPRNADASADLSPKESMRSTKTGLSAWMGGQQSSAANSRFVGGSTEAAALPSSESPDEPSAHENSDNSESEET